MKFLLALIVSCTLATCTMAQGANSFIKVKGQATVKATPEEMQVYIPLEVRDLTYENCSEKLKTTFNSLNNAFKKAGFNEDELKSDRLAITEAYDYQSGQRVKVGYSGTIQLFIQTTHTPENLARVMNTLQKDAFKFGYSLNFGLSEAQKEKLKKQVLEDAVADAKEKAEILSGAAGLRLGTIYEINFEFDSHASSPLMNERMYASEMAKADGNDISLNPQDQEIRKEVGIVWQLIDPK